MSDISPLVLRTLHEQLRELEMDAVLIRGRTEQLRETIGYLEAECAAAAPARATSRW